MPLADTGGLPAGAVRQDGPPSQHNLVGSRSDPTVAKAGEYVMTVCNACRYCEQFCPVFQIGRAHV